MDLDGKRYGACGAAQQTWHVAWYARLAASSRGDGYQMGYVLEK